MKLSRLLTVWIWVFLGHSGLAQAQLLKDLTVGNLSAYNATASFRSTAEAGVPVPSTALLQWGETLAYGQRTALQYSSDSKPDGAVSGLRAMYLNGLKPATNFYWKITATGPGGLTEEKTGQFTTLAINPSSQRGPSGKHVPPHTPEYGSAAKFVAEDWSRVNALLQQCSGGEVIEVAASGQTDTRTVVLTGGQESWPRNVLIRPAAGKRGEGAALSVEINSPHLTVAGFHLKNATMYPKYGVHRGNSQGVGARRSFFWMCTLERGGMLLANGCPDSGWYELVAPQRGVGADRAQIKVFAGIAPDNFTIAGCWLEGKDRTNGLDHCDTLQVLGTRDKPVTGLRMIDTVFFRSANCCAQMTSLTGTLIQNCWFGPLRGRSAVNGSYYATLGACREAIIKDSDWNGSFRQDAVPREVSNSSFHKLEKPGELSQNNVISGALKPQPPMPNLEAIWPR